MVKMATTDACNFELKVDGCVLLYSLPEANTAYADAGEKRCLGCRRQRVIAIEVSG